MERELQKINNGGDTNVAEVYDKSKKKNDGLANVEKLKGNFEL